MTKMQKYGSEFLGTFILLMSIVGSGIMGQQYTEDQMVILLSHALVIAFTLIFLISLLLSCDFGKANATMTSQTSIVS